MAKSRIDEKLPVGTILTYKIYRNKGFRAMVVGRKPGARTVQTVVISPLKGYETNAYWGIGSTFWTVSLNAVEHPRGQWQTLTDEEIPVGL